MGVDWPVGLLHSSGLFRNQQTAALLQKEGSSKTNLIGTG